MVDFKKLSPEERAICNANFLKSREALSELIEQYRNGIKAEKRQAIYEKHQEVKKAVADINSEIVPSTSIQSKNTTDIAQTMVSIMQSVEKIVNKNINDISDDKSKMEALSASLGCKRLFNKAYKEGATAEDMEAFAIELHNRIYPEGIKSVIKQAAQYTTNGVVIDGKNVNAVKQALNKGICLLLQLSTKGNLTAFLCTNNYKEIENLYGSEYYHAVMAHAIAHSIMDSFKPVYERKESEPNPHLHKVLSASLRIKEVKKGEYDLSSSTYTYNEDKAVACIELDSPTTLGNQLQTSLNEIDKIPSHELAFDMGIYGAFSRSPLWETCTQLICFAKCGRGTSDVIAEFGEKYRFWAGIVDRGYLSNL